MRRNDISGYYGSPHHHSNGSVQSNSRSGRTTVTAMIGGGGVAVRVELSKTSQKIAKKFTLAAAVPQLIHSENVS